MRAMRLHLVSYHDTSKRELHVGLMEMRMKRRRKSHMRRKASSTTRRHYVSALVPHYSLRFPSLRQLYLFS